MPRDPVGLPRAVTRPTETTYGISMVAGSSFPQIDGGLLCLPPGTSISADKGPRTQHPLPSDCGIPRVVSTAARGIHTAAFLALDQSAAAA
jgi:hypothetical protein